MHKRVNKRTGEIFWVPDSKRGNEEYAYRSGIKIATYKQKFLQGITDFSVLFITLATPYKSTWNECLVSWRAIHSAIGPFIKSLKSRRKKEVIKHMAVLEATEEGCAHCHLLVVWNRSVKAIFRNDKYFLGEKELLSDIKDKWGKAWGKVSRRKLNNNVISVQVCPHVSDVEKAFDYVTKHLGIGSNIEKSLERAQANMASDSDLKKLFSNYWGFKLGIRLYRVSRNL